MKTKNMTILHLGKSIGRSPLRLGFLLIPLALALAWFALSPPAQAVTPPPDGGYPGFNTAEGTNALFSLTTGSNNTATGFSALYSNTSGSGNTATGVNALRFNTTGNFNTATGVYALFSNTTGFNNTATGSSALRFNTTGFSNTATGSAALYSNTTGSGNTATNYLALKNNTTGSNNTAYGGAALRLSNGSGNTAIGAFALFNSATADLNTAYGWAALQQNTTGRSNIALGAAAGRNLTTGSDNIDIVVNAVPEEEETANSVPAAAVIQSNTIRIGKVGTHANTFIAGIRGVTVAGGVGVIIDSSGHLGTVVSSERFKDEIKPMDKASEAILALKPVTFRYKHDLDPEGIPQFGLVAEQVEKVNPALVARDAQGKVYTVRYEAVNAMLLNEFLKEHGKVEEQGRKLPEQEVTITEQRKSFQASITKLEATVAHQRKDMEALTARLKEQAAQIQKVSDQLEVSKAAPQMVVNNQ
jgi:trimeric autotransporter adhesin